MIAEELNCLDSPNQACFYTSGKTRPMSLRFFCSCCAAVRNQQSAGLLEHVPRVVGSCDGRDARRRQGYSTLEDMEAPISSSSLETTLDKPIREC